MGLCFEEFHMRKTLLAAAALAALAPQVVFASQDCLRVGYIHNWKVVNDRTLIIEDNRRKKFKVQLMGFCSNLPWHERLAFKSFGGTELSCLTPGDQVITHDFGTGPQRCAIRHIIEFTPNWEKQIGSQTRRQSTNTTTTDCLDSMKVDRHGRVWALP